MSAFSSRRLNASYGSRSSKGNCIRGCMISGTQPISISFVNRTPQPEPVGARQNLLSLSTSFDIQPCLIIKRGLSLW